MSEQNEKTEKVTKSLAGRKKRLAAGLLIAVLVIGLLGYGVYALVYNSAANQKARQERAEEKARVLDREIFKAIEPNSAYDYEKSVKNLKALADTNEDAVKNRKFLNNLLGLCMETGDKECLRTYAPYLVKTAEPNNPWHKDLPESYTKEIRKYAQD